MRARNSVILVRKHGSRRYSTKSFVEVAETSYQMLEVLSFSDQERVQPPVQPPSAPSLKVTVLTFLVKKWQDETSREVYILRIREKT